MGFILPGCDADADDRNQRYIHPCRVGGHGPAVVMLHGFGTTGDMWGHLAGALIEDHMIARSTCVVGLSSKPDGGYDKKNQAADVVGVLDAWCAYGRIGDARHRHHGRLRSCRHSTERVNRWVAIDAPLPASDPGIRSHRIQPCGTLASWSGHGAPGSRPRAHLSDRSGMNFPGPERFDERSASIMRRSMRNPAQCERASPSSWRSARMRRQQDVPCAGQASDAGLGLGGEATFGPRMGTVMRCVADNVEDVIIRIAGTGSRKNSRPRRQTCHRLPDRRS